VATGDKRSGRVSGWGVEFVEQTRERLGIRAWGRDVMEAGDSLVLRARGAASAGDLAGKSAGLRSENTYFGNAYSEKSVG
jgi:hypothetical protein